MRKALVALTGWWAVVFAVWTRHAQNTTVLASNAPVFSNPTTITNQYLPLSSLKQDILEGTEKGKKLRVERTMKPGTKTFVVNGRPVQAAIMEDREFLSGELEEVTLDYFAQSDGGDVHYMGEDVDNYKKGKVVAHEGGWLYGKDTKHMGTIFPGHPQIGMKFQLENVRSGLFEKDEVVALSETVTVPAGTFKNCVKIKEISEDETEYKYYAPGVGVIKEAPEDGEVNLISHQTN